MKEIFIVKHSVGGKIFIDTKKQQVDYKLEQVGDSWKFTIKTPMNSAMGELLLLKHELNVFVFHEFEHQPTIKTWYYIKDGPVTYDERQQELTLIAESRIEYIPDRFMS